MKPNLGNTSTLICSDEKQQMDLRVELMSPPPSLVIPTTAECQSHDAKSGPSPPLLFPDARPLIVSCYQSAANRTLACAAEI